ncbi:MAG TPA: glycoside hydrolase family 172 protein [Bacteroidales bacterium]|nr:glycoside hydrolase family 172 protein [Bacteroidales bacterium]
MKLQLIFILLTALLISCNNSNKGPGSATSDELFVFNDKSQPRWVSFENITGEKGAGGKENFGAKGHACDSIAAGATKVLLNMKGPGIINRMWITISDRSPQMLRSLVLKIYWDNQEKPAVSVPFGDFFGIGLGKTAAYENALFANPESRSFNSFVQMPFKEAAKVELVNESSADLTMVFYDINLQMLPEWNPQYMYFHCYWHRDTLTQLTKDFEILPEVKGKGRFIGSNISILANPVYKDSWWGEGEVKMYLDGDSDFPTLVGTGTEDYIGTAWGQGQYFSTFMGCPVADEANKQWTFYRYHIPDPIYFKTDCKVTIQQIGGQDKKMVTELQEAGKELIPVTIHAAPTLVRIFSKDSVVNLKHSNLIEGWTNFYRRDDLSAAAYFYLDSPSDHLPDLQPVSIRTYKLK